MRKFVTVARLSDVPSGACRSVEVDGAGIALFNVDGVLFALDNCCPHAGGPLGEGVLSGETVTCPWHGWRINVRTGARPENPEITVQRYTVNIEGDEIQVDLSQTGAGY